MTPTPSTGPTPGEPTLVGFVAGIGNALDVVVSGGYANIASDAYGVAVVDPSVPTVAGAADRPFFGQHLAISGTRAVTTGRAQDGTTHLWVLDLADPTRPAVLGELSTTIPAGGLGEFMDVVVNSSGTLAVAAVGTTGVWVIDLSNPSSPELLGTYDTPGTVWGVALNAASTLVYVADGASGLKVLGLGNPSQPNLVGSLVLGGTQRGIDVVGGYAYLANQNGTLRIIDVNNPAAPVLKGRASLTGFGYHVACEGALCAAISGNATNDYLDIVDVSNPVAPVRTGSTAVAPAGSGKGVDLVAGRAYVAANGGGLVIYTTGGSPTLEGSVDDTFVGQALDVAAGKALIVGKDLPSNTALMITLDVSVPSEPELLGQLGNVALQNYTGVAVNNTATMAVVTQGTTGLVTVDLSNPSAPDVLGAYDSPGTAWGVVLNTAGTIAYVADGASGLRVVSLSNPSNPTSIGSLTMSGTMRAIDLQGSLVYLANQSGTLRVVDVANPSAPVLRGGGSITGFGYHVAVEGTLAAVISGNATNDYLDIVDVTNPILPVKIGSVAIGPAGAGKGVDITGGKAYVAAADGGLQIYDLANRCCRSSLARATR